MTENSHPVQEPDSDVSSYYENYSETQKEVLAIEIRRTRKNLFIAAAVLMISGFLGLAMLNAFNLITILAVLVIPVILTGLGFLANKEPLTAIIIAAVVFLGEWIYSIAITGGRAAIMGWLVRAIVIYLLIAGLQHAKEAMRIKKELGV
ncbi:MAG TPA: hypothetical protein VFI06_00640 [Chitinophagaceae bacterium]|nr:hypothetical protein [Chitinophagaceae bacterium]